MNERKAPKDLDEALDALAQVERAAWPEVSGQLRARVLSDAAEVSASQQPAAAQRLAAGRPGFLGRLLGLDLWAGAAVAAVLLCLALGLGLGYEVGDTVLAGAGFDDEVRVARLDEDDPLLFPEDML